MKLSKGFTLIELMIVVAIIGILAAILVPAFSDKDPMTLEQKQAIIDRSLQNAEDVVAIIKTVSERAIEAPTISEKFEDDRASNMERAEKPENFNSMQDDFDYSNR